VIVETSMIRLRTMHRNVSSSHDFLNESFASTKCRQQQTAWFTQIPAERDLYRHSQGAADVTGWTGLK